MRSSTGNTQLGASDRAQQLLKSFFGFRLSAVKHGFLLKLLILSLIYVLGIVIFQYYLKFYLHS